MIATAERLNVATVLTLDERDFRAVRSRLGPLRLLPADLSCRWNEAGLSFPRGPAPLPYCTTIFAVLLAAPLIVITTSTLPAGAS